MVHYGLKKIKTNSFLSRSLDAIKVELLQQLQNLQGAPSVQMQQVPPLFQVNENEENDGGPEDDERLTSKTRHGDGDKRAHEAEFYDKVD
jgi:histone deacetylase 1/2